jgi:hypothetical protein
MEIDFTSDIQAAKKGKAPLNKPFRLPSGSKKKFGVYVKNDKGNIVKVTFGDPNMSIKRDNPERRKSYRARHGCDNPGPKYKANYWSCKMWSAKPVSKITGSCGKPNCGSIENEEEIILEIDVQAKNKGLWYNIQQKKKRMGKNYKPAKPGSKDRPTQEALKKAQGSDYENENYEWDGETEFDQNELLKIDATLNQVETMDDKDMEAHEMSEGQLSAIADKSGKLLEAISNPEVAVGILEPWVQNKLAIIDDYMSTIYDYIMYPSKEEQTQNQQNEAKWTKEYKDSIDCKNPKGFSQRAHCQSLKKK